MPFLVSRVSLWRSVIVAAAVLSPIAADAGVEAQELLATHAAEALTEADKRAAAQAEREALDRDEAIKAFEWRGPDGATGLLIVSGEFPNFFSMGRCRHLVHIIRHKNDGGVNPTFNGVVCRDWEGKWSVRKP